MESIKDFFVGLLSVAGLVLYLAVACMVGVLPLMIGFYLWQKVLG